MTTLRQEPGCRIAGKGLFINFQWRLLRLKATLLTCSLQSPTLLTEIVRSAQQQAVTPPKEVEPLTASFPEGAFPDTAMVVGPAGSSLSTVIVAAFAPRPVGWKRIGTSRASPAPITSG